MPETIVERNMLSQYHGDYRAFALYCEMQRSVPNMNDGLIPVHRRTVHCAWEYCHAYYRENERPNLMKCANVIGATMSHDHPHGDAGIQTALYTMINWYQTKYPLFLGQGNFGNTFTSTGASPRYTEATISAFCRDVVLDEVMQFKDVIDWTPNYDKRSLEPLYLPTKVPLLLLNGSMHMSVGDKVDVPSHNICEVIDETIKLIKDPNHQVVLIPDHTQACEIIDTDWKEMSRTGYGLYKVRGVIEIREYFGKTKKYKGRTVLAIRSCPNLTYLGNIITSIEKLVKDNKLIGIEDIEDESGIDDMNYILVLRPGVDPNFVKESIYTNTRLQNTFRLYLKVFVDDGMYVSTKRMNYTEYLTHFIDIRRITKQRYYCHKHQKIQTRLHVVNNYIWAFESKKVTDEVLNLIRKKKVVDDAELIEDLIKKFGFTDLQAKFIIDMEVKKLSQGWYLKFKEEKEQLDAEAKICANIIANDDVLDQIIIDELEDIKKKYGDKRKCRVISAAEASGIPQGIFKISLSEQNMLKKFGPEENITGTRSGDRVKFLIKGDNSKNILLFGNKGRVYNIPLSKIPFADKSSPGTDVRIINKNINAPITAVIYEPLFEQYKDGYLVVVTKSGLIKKMTIGDFLAVPPSGLVYTNLDPDDYVISVNFFYGNNADIVIYNQNKALKLNIAEIPLFKRNAKGNISMGGTNKQVNGMSVLKHDSTEYLVCTANGYINKITPDTLPSGRAKAGKSVTRLTKGDYIVAILGVNEASTVRVLTNNGQHTDIAVNTIPMGSSVSVGYKANSGIIGVWNL